MNALALRVLTPEGEAGEIARDDKAFAFRYALRAAPEVAVSLTMPARRDAYRRATLHPVFQMNLPEGYLLEKLRLRLAKTSGADPMLLLSLFGGDAAIGRLRFEATESLPRIDAGRGERLADILAYRGARGLFDSLLDRYLMRSGLSGVQPKLLVPERGKAAALTSDLIVKSGLDEYPGLAINEFVCMSAVKAAGIPVPEFHLSDDRSLFVMRRFDRDAQGAALGFEDLCALAGRDAQAKYQGRYEDIARLIAAFASPEHVTTSLAQLFDMVAISCIVGNGDAHLKNFGLLYAGGLGLDAVLAPAYDIVNTTCYLPEDSLALTLGGHKSLFASRQTLLDFAPGCRLTPKRARERIVELIDTVAATMKTHRSLVDDVPGLHAAMSRGVTQFRASFRTP